MMVAAEAGGLPAGLGAVQHRGEDRGRFTVKNVPPGKYTVKAWHPRFGIKKAKVTVPAGGSVKTDFTFSAK